jgi:hypothetical protein
VTRPPEQLIVEGRVHANRSPSGQPFPWAFGVELVKALEESLAEIKRLRERVVELEQERFE